MAVDDFLIQAKNRVPDLQRQYQASSAPLYLRGTRGKLYFNSFVALWSVGVAGTLYGFSTLIVGKKKE